jgi:hypothetical protein
MPSPAFNCNTVAADEPVRVAAAEIACSGPRAVNLTLTGKALALHQGSA